MAQSTELERMYNQLDDTQWWPKERLRAAQRADLTRLVNHARSTTDFYRTRLNCLFKPNGEIDWSKWSDLPIVTRADLSWQSTAIRSSKPVLAHGPFGIVKTSGSTGDPVSMLTTRLLSNMSTASLWRGQKWANFDWSATMIHLGADSEKWKAGDLMGPWGPYWMKDALKGKRVFSTYSTSPAQRLDFIKTHGADYAVFSSGTAVSFAEYLRASRTSARLNVAHFRGASANAFVRSDFRELLGAEIVEIYSSKEGGALAAPCPLGHGWHQNAESVLLEVVDDHGKPVQPGQTGRVVITPFGSTAMPLIRYDQGDRAIAGPIETCPCGRTLPRITAFMGRLRDEFRRPNGEIIPDLSMTARVQLGAGIWQIARVAEHSFEVRYKKRDWGVAPDLDAFRKSFSQEFYPDARLELIEVDGFVPGPTGKHREGVDEWGASLKSM